MRVYVLLSLGVFSASISGCQFTADVDRYCECSRVVVEAGEGIADLDTEVQNAKSKLDLRKIWKKYEAGVKHRERAFRSCLSEFEMIDDSVEELYMAYGRYASKSSSILLLLEFAESSSQSVGEMQKLGGSLAGEIEEVAEVVRNEREGLCK